MAKSKKLPAIQWYPGDWRKDPGVQSLDYRHRGVWFEVLMLMHESEDRGSLKLNGKPTPVAASARLLGLPTEEWIEVRATLLDYGVADEDEDGALICRRMVRDEDLRRKRAKSGQKGGRAKQTRSKPEANALARPALRTAHSEANTEGAVEGHLEAKMKQPRPPSSSPSSSPSVSAATSVDRAVQDPPSSGNSAVASPNPAAREDDEELEEAIHRELMLARRNIVAIHGDTEDPVEIGGCRVGVGIEINRFKRLCRAGSDPPNIIARAIAFVPQVSGLEPPISLARWEADDGPAVYEQCVGEAHKAERPISIGLSLRTLTPRDTTAVAARRREMLAQVQQLRSAVSVMPASGGGRAP